jgi:hypothetical protein
MVLPLHLWLQNRPKHKAADGYDAVYHYTDHVHSFTAEDLVLCGCFSDDITIFQYDRPLCGAMELKAAKAQVVAAIVNAPAASTETAVGVPSVAGTPTLDVVAKAEALLSDEAENIAVIMNRATHPDFIAAIAANGYLFDPFQNRRVVYDNTLPTFESATSGNAWLIVGDLSAVQANFPNGDDVKLKYDDLTEAEDDLVKIVGRLYAAIGVTAPGRLAKVTKN